MRGAHIRIRSSCSEGCEVVVSPRARAYSECRRMVRLVGVSRMQPTYRGDGTPDRTGSLFLSYTW